MIREPSVRYRSPDEDSGRWRGFPFRPGDIVISTRSKSGTTWMQMICALLIFQIPEPPSSLGSLSPWLDHLIAPTDQVVAGLSDQRHRRFIKTHTPLDGIPIRESVTYVVVARHPLDMAVSLYHHGDNLDRDRIRQLTGQAPPSAPAAPRPTLHDWLLSWIDRDVSPQDELDSLPGVMWHVSDAWGLRAEPNVVLVHYDDLSTDLEGEMRRLADRLGIDVPADRWDALVDAARFESMQSRADQLVPNQSGILKDNARFFLRGTSGAGNEVLSEGERDHYAERIKDMGPPDLLSWLHRPDGVP